MDIEDLVDKVMLDVPDCPLMTIRQAVLWAARDFCTRADAWVERDKHVVAMINPLEGQVISPTFGEPVRLVSLKIGDKDTTQDGLWQQPTPTTVKFTREIEDQILIGALAMRPHRDKAPPEEVIIRWGEAFEDGARYRLLIMPQPWRDPDMAQHYRTQFSQAVSEAKAASRLGHARGHNRVKPRRFI